jgi:hypothetical protein
LSGGLSQAWSIAVGAPAPGSKVPALFAAGVVNGVYGLFRSDNGGASSYTRELTRPLLERGYGR